MYLLDSNILIGYLNGNKKEIHFITEAKKKGGFLCFSVISKIETLSLSVIKAEHVREIESFLNTFSEVYLSEDVVKLSAGIRRNLKLSLGDAVILGIKYQTAGLF